MSARIRTGAKAAAAGFLLLALTTAFAETSPRLEPGVISGLGIRNIGSAAMSGRISALAAAHRKDRTIVLYVGAASGGVWKSTDGGTTFTPKFDKQKVQSIGAIALDPKDPETVWVGTGEAWTRNSVSIGDGIYRSRDGGETWTHMGLPQSERIVKIIVHPENSAVVYACVTGKLWSDSDERGATPVARKRAPTFWDCAAFGGAGGSGAGQSLRSRAAGR